MPESPLYNIIVSEHAKMALRTLGHEERILISSWFDHLKNWNNDAFIRSHSKLLEEEDGTYLFKTGTDLYIVFRLLPDERAVLVLSIYRSDTVKAFERALGHTA